MASPKQTLFLSYTRRQPDESWASRVVRTIRDSFGLTVWFDKRGIRAGQPFDVEIDRAIRECSGLVFIGSSSSLVSPYCLYECQLARDLGKPFVPLFIEPVSWSGFPTNFHNLHYEQLFRVTDDDELAAVLGSAVIDAGVEIDRRLVPERKTAFDEWASAVYPEYDQIVRATDGDLQNLVEACKLKLGLRPESGYHNLNLALLLLHAKDFERAVRYIEVAQVDLPGSADVSYFSALILASNDPLNLAPRAKVRNVLEACDVAIALQPSQFERPNVQSTAALPWLLKAVIAYDCFESQGLLSRIGRSQDLIKEARDRPYHRQELDRLRASLTGCSPLSKQCLGQFG
jgi:hypothetical protein